MKTNQAHLFRHYIVVGLLVGLTIVMASCSSTPATTPAYTTPISAITQYQNSNYGYSINVLPKWAVNSTDVSSVVIGSTDTLDYVHIVSSAIKNTDLTQFVTDCEKVFQADYPQTYAKQSSAQITISGGLVATLLTVVFVKDEVPMQASVLATIKGNYGYCVVGAAPLADWSTYKNDLTSIINSLDVN
jgi:hypothetical protein